MALFDPLVMRGTTFRNRIGCSPMCQYSCAEGFANDWHLVHLGARAVGGAALVMTEATSVEPHGRISPEDLGLWRDEHIEPLAKVARFVSHQGAEPGIQLAHAGRKASTAHPSAGGKPLGALEGGWEVVGPSPIPFGPGFPTPRALDASELPGVVGWFKDAAIRARTAGFRVLEIHAAHGYLLHSFLSPLANRREDAYGGTFDNRVRLLLEITGALRAIWPEESPLFVRISASDWTEGGWTVEDSVALARQLKVLGVDAIDCSSGGVIPHAKVPSEPGYQVPFAERIRQDAGIATVAVGLLTEARQVEQIIGHGQADMVFLARELLREPYWPLHAARELGIELTWPVQYQRAKT